MSKTKTENQPPKKKEPMSDEEMWVRILNRPCCGNWNCNTRFSTHQTFKSSDCPVKAECSDRLDRLLRKNHRIGMDVFNGKIEYWNVEEQWRE